ncbi:MAG: hypothetical protein LC641_01130 [Spirochaeta sp.]|nr:hypothetical protein [Spirochaeta sp.]
MKKLLLSMVLVGSMSLLFLACEPVDGDFEQPMEEPMEQPMEEDNGF